MHIPAFMAAAGLAYGLVSGYVPQPPSPPQTQAQCTNLCLSRSSTARSTSIFSFFFFDSQAF